MQIRALREALDRAVRDGENTTYEAKALREELLCERLRHNELKLRYKDLQKFHNATTVGEVEMLQTENRRLRSALAEASLERTKLMEEARPQRSGEPSAPPPTEEPVAICFESPEPDYGLGQSFENRVRRLRK